MDLSNIRFVDKVEKTASFSVPDEFAQSVCGGDHLNKNSYKLKYCFKKLPSFLNLYVKPKDRVLESDTYNMRQSYPVLWEIASQVSLNSKPLNDRTFLTFKDDLLNKLNDVSIVKKAIKSLKSKLDTDEFVSQVRNGMQASKACDALVIGYVANVVEFDCICFDENQMTCVECICSPTKDNNCTITYFIDLHSQNVHVFKTYASAKQHLNKLARDSCIAKYSNLKSLKVDQLKCLCKLLQLDCKGLKKKELVDVLTEALSKNIDISS